MSQSLDASTLSHSQSEKYPEIQPVVPMNRVKTIMKSSPEVSAINTETLYVVCKATEQFISALVKETYRHSKNNSDLDYRNLAQLVENNEKFEFLQEIIPMKVKASEALKIIETENEKLKI